MKKLQTYDEFINENYNRSSELINERGEETKGPFVIAVEGSPGPGASIELVDVIDGFKSMDDALAHIKKEPAKVRSLMTPLDIKTFKAMDWDTKAYENLIDEGFIPKTFNDYSNIYNKMLESGSIIAWTKKLQSAAEYAEHQWHSEITPEEVYEWISNYDMNDAVDLYLENIGLSMNEFNDQFVNEFLFGGLIKGLFINPKKKREIKKLTKSLVDIQVDITKLKLEGDRIGDLQDEMDDYDDMVPGKSAKKSKPRKKSGDSAYELKVSALDNQKSAIEEKMDLVAGDNDKLQKYVNTKKLEARILANEQTIKLAGDEETKILKQMISQDKSNATAILKDVKESVDLNEAKKYENTWYTEISNAQMADRGRSHYDNSKFDKPDGIPNQRSTAEYINPDINWSKKSDKEVKKYLSDLKKKIVAEVKISEANKKLHKLIKDMSDANKFRVTANNGNVGKEIEIGFITPILYKAFNNDNIKLLDFLQNSEEVKIEAYPTVKGWSVFYDGDVTNGVDTYSYDKVENGFARTLD